MYCRRAGNIIRLVQVGNIYYEIIKMTIDTCGFDTFGFMRFVSAGILIIMVARKRGVYIKFRNSTYRENNK
jgi:hypothetical protein